ncbi:MAG: prepilin-type N-terminal cleavage/methylation domain-containing protein [Candidatus Omnitrophica bacterium]|nr:prepilin-type N-terminal cleavage/methylation domain-containing protein [Candidatus Omnitrophota bacterium]
MRCRGFTLIEVAVTVAILAIVIAIALPSFMKMNMVANEEAVLEAIRSVVQACDSWQSNTQTGFPDNLSQLTGANPPYLDGRFRAMFTAGNVFKGYRFAYNSPPGGTVVNTQAGAVFSPALDTFTLAADPIQRGVTGQRSFFVDQSGAIRFDTRGPANANSTPVEQSGS